MTLGLFRCLEKRGLFFLIFLVLTLVKFIALLALQMALFWDLRTVTSANGLFLSPTLTQILDKSRIEGL